MFRVMEDFWDEVHGAGSHWSNLEEEADEISSRFNIGRTRVVHPARVEAGGRGKDLPVEQRRALQKEPDSKPEAIPLEENSSEYSAFH